MTDDIVARLREHAGQYDEYDWTSEIEIEAADEIEQLRAELRCAHQAADDVYKRLMPEIARKDAALENLIVAVDYEAIRAAYGDDIEQCMKVLLDCANEARAALAPTQETSK